ncbi:unnamed protein product [Brachionus calyciflorus]|uniref:MULE transposase domain-containing protein n=1 Tax=Brachionus calyciflorus TaxID=104777 RepID=A0A813WBW7_9BILA|nr:unnamed protein product [Brachionus calyciflorus]
MKGCHFHFTQALWKNIQKLGLVDDYNRNSNVKDWLNNFKSLSFLPEKYIADSLNQLKANKPRSSKLTQFLQYFETTWINHKVYKIDLWNHFDTLGPRTNNHVEGDNHKVNSYIDFTHPHIYSAINTFKSLETTTSLNYHQRLLGGLSQFPRRPKDILKDQLILNHKMKLELNQITCSEYIKRINNLFSYDKESKSRNLAISETIEPSLKVPTLSIFKISRQSYSYIQNYIRINRSYLINLVIKLREYQSNLHYFNQNIDEKHFCVLKKWNAQKMTTLTTTGDGNCL